MAQQQARTIFVSGATGNCGRATIKYLQAYSQQYPIKIRAGTTDPKRAQEELRELLTKGNIELVYTHSDDPKSLEDALRGCEAALIVPPKNEKRVATALAFLEAAKRVQLPFIALISISEAENEGIMFGKQWKEIENAYKTSGLPYCFLRCNFFMENLAALVPDIKEKGMFGLPLAGSSKFSHVAIEDVGRTAAHILLDTNKHKNKIYQITGPEDVSPDDLTTVLTRLSKRGVRFEQVDKATAVNFFVGKGMPKWLSEGVVELFEQVQTGRSPMNFISKDVESITGKRGMTTEEWLGMQRVFA